MRIQRPRFILLILVAAVFIGLVPGCATNTGLRGSSSVGYSGSSVPFRPPAIPLVAFNPYFSIWSFDTVLTDGPTKHWTGTTQALTSLVRIDGKPYRLMGDQPRRVPALSQKSVTVYPTRTVYQFGGPGVDLTLTFLTPRIPQNMSLFARPVTYITWDVVSTDGGTHAVQLYFDCTGSLVVNKPYEDAEGSLEAWNGLRVARLGSKSQNVLATKGDYVRIDWGYLYVAAPSSQDPSTAVATVSRSRSSFVDTGIVTPGVSPKAEHTRLPSDLDAAFSFDLGTVGSTPVSRHIILAYDELYSIMYFGTELRPYWRADGSTPQSLLETSEADYAATVREASAFDGTLMEKLRTVGGPKYAQIAALAYRQSLAAQTLAAAPDGQPLLFPKENSSNGCISTVDVIYPGSPLLLLLSPELLKAELIPVFDYARSGRWQFPFAPHDLGTYPVADGQVYGGGAKSEKDQMPVEESGDMILLTAAYAQAASGANEFLKEYWPLLTQWAEYLKEQGFDPANQLSTDDFAGHLAHNANLSLKAILAIGAYASMAKRLGYDSVASDYRKSAEDFAKQWVARASDGDHFRLAFDRPGTWSQKYNLAWDSILHLNLFPSSVTNTIVRFDLSHLNRYGIPLDSRKNYTKLDWEFWTATLSDTRAELQRFIDPIYAWVSATANRVPLTDWYDTKTGLQQGFQARSVVGGVFMPMLRW